ncbi:hypothetical protein BV898_17506 [Hypsibius exemplaris]|uniref:Uncharacterized protein n=1 Tax=Hypsibius exemplaris TaxID=2072580 RepID=A0A9X6NI69_HYPEX|nr:hypothetical protein BV898_17506 [Hypsibius exemplaris]
MTLSKISTFGKISGTGAVSGVEPVPPLLRTTKELVEYFKRNGLSRKLRKTLKTAIQTCKHLQKICKEFHSDTPPYSHLLSCS